MDDVLGVAVVQGTGQGRDVPAGEPGFGGLGEVTGTSACVPEVYASGLCVKGSKL